MSKKGYLLRLGIIEQKVQKQPYITKSELLKYLEAEAENMKLLDDEIDVRISARTLERDLREIRNLMGINIEYSHTERGYYVEKDNFLGKMVLTGMVETFEIFRSLKMEQDLGNIIYLEKERPTGMEHLNKLIRAIKNRLRIRFEYTRYAVEHTEIHSGKPYALKVYERRWYLLMEEDGYIKTFGLDRMNDLEITSETFIPNSQIDVEAKFQHSFGITIPNNDEQPQEVILAFSAKSDSPMVGAPAKYVKSLPLHHSQKIVSETPDELRVSLNVYLTIELESKILWFGEGVKVIQPQKLADAVKDRLKKTLERY